MIGYTDIHKTAALAAAANEHLLLLGSPGTGKSMFALSHFGGYEGEIFSTQLSRWADETVLFGPPNIRALREKGEIRYAQSGLLAATWAYIDEAFDASDVLLRTLLGILQERRFSRGSFSVRVPLRSAVATANYTRSNEMTEAVIDRFLFRASSPSLEGETRNALWNGYSVPGERPTDGERTALAELDAIRHRATSIPLPDTVRDMGRAWADRLSFSPRREAKIAWAVRVHAAMRQAEACASEDLLGVVPWAVSLAEDLNGQQRQIREDLAADLRRADGERQQMADIAAICCSKKKDNDHLANAKRVAQAIRRLHAIEPVTDEIRAERDAAVKRFAAAHTDYLRALEVLA